MPQVKGGWEVSELHRPFVTGAAKRRRNPAQKELVRPLLLITHQKEPETMTRILRPLALLTLTAAAGCFPSLTGGDTVPMSVLNSSDKPVTVQQWSRCAIDCGGTYEVHGGDFGVVPPGTEGEFTVGPRGIVDSGYRIIRLAGPDGERLTFCSR